MTTTSAAEPLAEKPTLTGDLVVLRPFQDDDLEALAEALADPQVARLTGSVATSAGAGLPPDPEVLREWYTSRNAQTDRLDLAIVDRATGGCVGEAVLNEWDPANASCNFRILIGPRGRDRGFGTESTRLLLRHAFDVVGLHRVELEVYAFNPRAQRAYEKAGFVVEGVRRQALRFDGEWVDAVVMAVLEDDPAVAAPQQPDPRG